MSCSPDDKDDQLVLYASSEHNYSFESEMKLEVVEIAASPLPTYDWSRLERNFLDQDLSVDELEGVHLVLWNYSADELAQAINEDNLLQSKIEVPLSYSPEKGETMATTSDFRPVGLPISWEAIEGDVLEWFDKKESPPESRTFTVMVTREPEATAKPQMLQAFVLGDDHDPNVVSIHDDSMALSWEASLTDLSPVYVPAGHPSLSLDWSDIEINALGRDFAKNRISRVLIGAYSLSLEELEDQFIELESIAEQLYVVDVPLGARADLSQAKTSTGKVFSGIDDAHLWLVGLMCDECLNPAPWYLTRLSVCP